MKKIKAHRRTFKRRSFLAGGLSALASLPIASSLLSARAIAQESEVPVRFLGLRSAHGSHRDLWIPRDATGNAPLGTDVALSELNFDYPLSFMAPIEQSPLKNKLTVIDGLDAWVNNTLGNSWGGHFGAASIPTGGYAVRENNNGRPSNESVDTFLYNRLAAGEGPHLISASCMNTDGDRRGMSFRADGSASAFTLDPGVLFQNVLSGAGGVANGGADLRPAQRGVFDDVITEIRQLESSVSGSELAKLQSHLEAMLRLQEELEFSPNTECGGANPGDVPNYDATNPAHVEQRARLHAQVIAQSFACGTSRFAMLHLTEEATNPYFSVPSIRALYPGESGEFHHPIVHEYWNDRTDDTRLKTIFALCHQWQTQVVLSTIAELDAVIDPMDPSGTKTILDNTIVYWFNEFGHGGHTEQGASQPTLIAGGGGGRFKMGRYLRLRDVSGNYASPSDSIVIPHNRLLTSICHAMGSPDVTCFGDSRIVDDPVAYGRFHGELSELMT